MSESAYLELLQQLVNKADGDVRQDRTGTGTYSIFGHQMRFDLSEGFPLLTTKKIHAHSVVHELLWFLNGDTNIKYLLENNVHIWTDWRLKQFNKMRNELGQREVGQQEFETCILTDDDFAKEWGDIGKGYGHQWRNFGESSETVPVSVRTSAGIDVEHRPVVSGFDQIDWVINEIKTNPTSRRLIVTGWNPQEVDQVDLPPCHTLFQFFVEPMTHDEMVSAYTKAGNVFSSDPMVEHEFIDVLCKAKDIPISKLSCQLYQRSADVFLGVPFNIASYALLTHMIAQVCGLAVGEFVWSGGDTHLYANHIEQAKLQLTREPMPLCRLLLSNVDLTKGNVHADVAFDNYQHHDAIKAPVAV